MRSIGRSTSTVDQCMKGCVVTDQWDNTNPYFPLILLAALDPGSTSSSNVNTP